MSRIYTANFTVSEMACKCDKCQAHPTAKMALGFMIKLQKIRELVATPLHINSGYRCKAHNETVGGVKDSFHTQGRACDISCTDSHIRALLFEASIRAGCYGFGVSANFIHIDDRSFSKFRMFLY